jgi:hypothetical protein
VGGDENLGIDEDEVEEGSGKGDEEIAGVTFREDLRVLKIRSEAELDDEFQGFR